MKKMTFFVLAWLCISLTLKSQSDCARKLTYRNLIEYEPYLIDMGGGHGLELRGFKNSDVRDVFLSDTLTFVIPQDLGCYSSLSISGPNEVYNNIQEGDIAIWTLGE